MKSKKHHLLITVIVCAIVIAACNESASHKPKVEKRDTTIKKTNSFSDLFFDSTALESFIQKEHMSDTLANEFRSFYNGRNYQFAWFFQNGLAEPTRNFWNTQNDYISYSGDSSLYSSYLQSLLDSAATKNDSINLSDADRLQAELLFTGQFLKYASRAYVGSKEFSPDDLQWFIPRKKINMVSLLDSVVNNKGKNSGEYEPLNRQYKLLKDYLIKYSKIEKDSAWAPIAPDQKKFIEGDRSPAVTAIKKRLFLTGDFTQTDTSSLFTDSLQAAVKNFQNRYGMKEDGVMGGATLREMNQSVQFRIRQILINMERMRWVPEEPKTDYLLVNIPAYKLYVYENGKLGFNMNVVVGKEGHNTVIFTGNLKYVVFSPYWNVPTSIVRNEVVPGMKRNRNYIASHNMEITGYSGSLPIVRQKPGAKNSLGRVKFLFPNSYNIYLHDTPAKSLFNEDSRAFSHGCIRLGEPSKLAQFLLRKDSSWTDEKIQKSMNSGKEQYVTLKNPIPVYIGYFTAFVDRKGQLNFRDDIYGHDAKMSKMMFK
ncbi:L,D-transpeptidase family protein [Pinibacter soli]|uniref:L,D-transpeptidase family protein n=1 Tax=Pinibacter soli TaxID=3044211 RepID=A0ABT6RL04_9BACT|nr:L,D-transpeptidase family protein [Pinibacter soli]MDI3322559.1 L,D-transpeptidase family protein [Pinibacter soli]